MKKLFAFFFLAVLLYSAHAQMNESLLPKSFSQYIPPSGSLYLPNFDIQAAHLADGENLRYGKFPLFSRNIKAAVNLHNSGNWITLENGDRVWSLKIVSKDALGIVPLFEKLYLPKGSTLHAYMPDRREVLGAFTHDNTPEPRAFCTGLLHGEECVLEYYEPAEVKGEGVLEIIELGHAYRHVYPLSGEGSRDIDAAGACEVNVACSEANNFADQKRSVARILVIANGGQGYCSGTLVNNVRQDCTPYLLSAQHCSEGTSSNQYAQWVFYFNYEASTCNGTTGPANKTITGCTKIADSNDNGGDSGSDFLLLELSTAPLISYNVFYSGWNSANTASTSGVSIHHPDGDIKKISTYSSVITSTTWGGAANSHWNVHWASTPNGYGVTEEGSSGGALFNDIGQVIGTLTGGGSFCNATNLPDKFGKMSYSWETNGSTSNRKLKPWLDPDNTGVASLAGTNAPCSSGVMNDAGIQSVIAPEGALCGVDSIEPKVLLRNFGSNTINFVTINYSIDGNMYQYTSNVVLSAGASYTITLPQRVLIAGSHTFTAETSSPNGQTDNNTDNDEVSITFDVLPVSNLVNLSLHTDRYGSETSWDVKDATNTVVASGGPFTDVNNGEQINTSFCLSSGCYTFTLRDSYGDGMGYPFPGSMTLTGNGFTYATLADPSFGDSEAFNFCVIATAVEEVMKSKTIVMPNPSSGVFNLLFADNRERIITLYDATGRLLMQSKVPDNIFVLNLSEYSKAIYILQIDTGTDREIQKLSLK